MRKLFPLCLSLALALGAGIGHADESSRLEITESPMPAGTFTKEEGERDIDTVVIHFASAINWFNASFQNILSDEHKALAESIGVTRENIHDHKYDWRLVKAIFETYRVSAHYIIARDGEIVRLVEDNDRAWHAGQSAMPNDPTRTGANAFSIGIELMSSHPAEDRTVVTPEDAYTEAQYEALAALMAQLCADHDIKYVVGHDEIAPGRKNDPGPLFQWDRVRGEEYAPIHCSE